MGEQEVGGQQGQKPSNGDARFAALTRSAREVVLAIDERRNVVSVGGTAAGTNQEEVLGKAIDCLHPAAVASEAHAKVVAAVEQGRPGSWFACGASMGTSRFVCRVLPMQGADEIRALVFIEDAGAQDRAASALRTSEERLTRALDTGRVGLYEIEPSSYRGTVSVALANLLGIPCVEMVPEEFLALIHPEDRPRATAFFHSLFAGEKQTADIEYRIRDKNGDYRWFFDRQARIERTDGSFHIAGVVFDITDLRELEEKRSQLQRQLEQAQRLESIGLLAGGVAHDFNNLLTVILTGTRLAQHAVAKGGDPREDLEYVVTAAERAAELTQQLLAFGRRSSLALGSIDVAELAGRVIRLAKRLLPKNIEIALEPFPAKAVVQGDSQQLEQALVNLCINARDAMPAGGRLRLNVSVVDANVEIRVRDNGSGIAACDLERIFEPFFTTKPPGAGTGLGLAMVHGIVQQHQGSIEVDSAEGHGTTFTIRLPVCWGEVTQSSSPPHGASRGSGRVLVAEDEVMVLALVERILTEAGYEVTAALDGAEALKKFAEEEHGFDLVLLDAIMPRLDGWSTYEQLRISAPDVPVLFCSGYAATSIPGQLGAGGPRLIPKPYQPEVLIRAVGEAIAQSRRGGPHDE